MTHFIIGSRLFKTLFPDNERIQKRCKETADYDVLVESEPSDEVVKYFKEMYGNKTEVHCIPPIWEYMIARKYGNLIITDVYFTLKASHVYFHKQHFEKTIFDLYLMAQEGCVIIEPLFWELYEFWKDKFGEPWRADFEQESSDFFDDAVSRENLHDELHKSVAHPDYGHPAFKFLQEPDQTTVWVSPEKFKNTTEHIRRRVIIEEAQALSLERDLLTGKIKNKTIAYQKWIKALVQRLAPLWMTIYIIDNLNYFLDYQEDYGNFKIN
jgi:hypothetical protein